MLAFEEFKRIYPIKSMENCRTYLEEEGKGGKEYFNSIRMGFYQGCVKAAEYAEVGKPVPSEWISAIGYPLNTFAEDILIEQMERVTGGDWYVAIKSLFFIQGPRSIEVIYNLIRESVENPDDERSYWISKAMSSANLSWVLGQE